MRNLKWFWVILFIAGGLLFSAIVYLLLRSSGILYKLIPDDDDKWVEYDA